MDWDKARELAQRYNTGISRPNKKERSQGIVAIFFDLNEYVMVSDDLAYWQNYFVHISD